MVYVISCDGKALMPTKRHAKVRILLKEKKAKVVETNPFTIKLLYSAKNYVQPIHLGIDSGYTYIGFSALTDKEEVISGELTLLSGQKQRLEKKAMHRGQRRSRKRHRKPRFDNRAIPKGWLAPSIQHKLDSHKRFIDMIKSILPISEITIEIGNFDIQKIKNPLIGGAKYQEGEQANFYNLREYILHRDNHTCQYCGEKEIPLQVHHIGYYKKDMSNRPSNLTAFKHNKERDDEMDKGKQYTVLGILLGWRGRSMMELGYRVVEVGTWEIRDMTKEDIQSRPGMEFTNLTRGSGGGLRGMERNSLKEYPMIDISTPSALGPEIIGNEQSRVVVAEDVDDMGKSKRRVFLTMSALGMPRLFTMDELIRHSRVANMVEVRLEGGKKTLRRKNKEEIPKIDLVPKYTQRVFENRGSRGAYVSEWLVRVLKPGEAYGRGYSQRNKGEECLVEFIDATTQQFVSRYAKSTLGEHPEGIGLNLHGGLERWKVTAEAMGEIVEWLEKLEK